MLRNTQLLSIAALLVTLAACIYIPVPEQGLISGRAIIPEEDIRELEDGVGVINREEILLKYGEPNKRFNNDEYFCYAWQQIQGYVYIGGPYGGGGGGPVGKTHWLCMQFYETGELIRLEHIDPLLFENADRMRDETLHEWNKTGASDEIRETGDYYNFDKIKLAAIHSLAEQGLPEYQWRLYEESGGKPEDIVWLCRSAD